MSFLTPLLAGIAAAIAIPTLVLLYFLKLRRKDVEISTTLLWKKTIQDFQANAPFQKLRTNILLLLQLLALVLILLALAQPQFMGESSATGRLVLIIDRSASMGARDETSDSGQAITRLEKAKSEAIAALDAIDTGGVFSRVAPEVMVIAFDSGAQLVQQFTSNLAQARSAIASLDVVDTPTDFASAAQVAEPFVGAQIDAGGPGDGDETVRPGAPALLLTDGNAPNLDRLRLAPGSDFRVRLLGEAETGNIGITAMRGERSLEDADSVSVFVALQSTFAEARAVDLELAIDGVVSAAREVRFDGAAPDRPAVGGAVFRFSRASGGVLTVRAIAGDALEVDDTARIVLPDASRLSIALVSTGNWAISAALTGLDPARFDTISPSDFPDADLRGYNLVVLDGMPTNPDGSPVELPGGRYLIFGGIPAFGGITPGEPSEIVGVSTFVDWQREHPSLRYLALEPVVMGRTLSVEHDERVQVLARGTRGALIFDVADATRRALVVAFRPGASNWPLDVSFVLFTAQAARWLGEGGGVDGPQSIQPGQTISTSLPEGARNAELTVPNQSGPIPLNPSADGRVSYGPIGAAGLYRLKWTGVAGAGDRVAGDSAFRLFAANLFDPVESRIGMSESAVLSTGESISGVAESGRVERPRRTWPWLALFGLAVVILEWFVYNRRMHL
ncbi:MAG: vWA domain-containing protein [Phycisphaerales bacterium]